MAQLSLRADEETEGVADSKDDFERETFGFTFKIILLLSNAKRKGAAGTNGRGKGRAIFVTSSIDLSDRLMKMLRHCLIRR